MASGTTTGLERTGLERTVAARTAIAAAVVALEAALEAWEALPSHEVPDAFGALVRLRARAEGAALALLLEAMTRGVIATSEHPREVEWIRAMSEGAGAPLTAAVAAQFRDVATQAALTEPDMRPLRSSVTRGRFPWRWRRGCGAT